MMMSKKNQNVHDHFAQHGTIQYDDDDDNDDDDDEMKKKPTYKVYIFVSVQQVKHGEALHRSPTMVCQYSGTHR